MLWARVGWDTCEPFGSDLLFSRCACASLAAPWMLCGDSAQWGRAKVVMTGAPLVLSPQGLLGARRAPVMAGLSLSPNSCCLNLSFLATAPLSSCFPTGQLWSQAARAPRALIAVNGPEDPHLGPTPMGSGAHLSSVLAPQPSLGCLAGLQLSPIPFHP